MKTFLVILVLAYAKSEKLDFTYLPPPGSQYAGGRPEDIQVPLEFPKETYTTILRPQDFDGGITNPEDYQATIGINRGLPTETIDASDVTLGSKAPFSYLQNTYKVPTTTVSYAFTQTTTHPPIEGFETTVGPQFDGTGFGSQDVFNKFQPQPTSTYQDNLNQPGYKQVLFEEQGPGKLPVAPYPGYSIQGPVTIGNTQQALDRPGFQQYIGQFGGRRPSAQTTLGPDLQLTGSTAQPQGSEALTEKDLQAQNRPEYKPTAYQFREQNPTFAPTSGLANNLPKQNLEIIGEKLHNQLPNSLNQPQTGYQQSISEVRPGIPFLQTQYQNQTMIEGNLVNQQVFFPSTILPQELFSTSRPGTTNGNGFNNIQGYFTPRPSAPQTSFPNQVGAGNIVNNENAYQRQPGSPNTEEPTYYENTQNIFQPSSTVAPTTFTSGIQKGQTLTGTSANPEINSTPVYPDAEYNNQVVKELSNYGQSPKRLQADTDRNAVILNYQNIVTPEGFAYSFDTSNGIHADESGTAINGVKAKGSYSYIGDDGKLYSIVYTADENGYQPHGDHLPTPPPIPKAIQEIIEKVKKEKEAGIYHDGSYDDDKYGYNRYQGAMQHGPQNPNKVLSNGAEIPTEYANETVLQDMKPGRPYTGLRKPIVSSGDLSDFNIANEKQSQYNDNEYDNDDDNVPDQILTQLPINRITALNGKENEHNMRDEGDQNQYFEVSSKRPSYQPMRKLISKIKGSSKDDNDERGQPGNRIGSQQIADQGSFGYVSEGPFEDSDSNINFPTKGYSRRPSNQNRPEYGQDDRAFEYDNGSKRPLNTGTLRPVINAPENSFDEYENTRPGKFSSRFPSNRPIIGNIQDQFQSNENYNLQKSGSQPSYKPFEYPDKDVLRRVTDIDDNKEYVTKSPSIIQPDDNKSLLTSAPRNQTTSTRRRPAFIPETSNTQMEDVEYQPDDGEENIGSGKFGNIPSQKYTGKPTMIYTGQYKETEQEFNENIPKRGYNDGSQPASSIKYGANLVKPQHLRPFAEPQTVIQDSRGQVLKGDKKPNVPEPKFGQKLSKPFIYQQPIKKENAVYSQQPVVETGYQYIPPQRMFEQEEPKRFPTMKTGPSKVTSTRRPLQQNVFYEKGAGNSKPFMTPYVISRDQTGFTVDEYGQEDAISEPEENQKHQQSFSTQYSQYPDSGTTPDQIFDDEIISSTKPPSKYTSSTYGPSSPRGQLFRPQYHQNTQSHRPVQDTNRFNGYKSTKTPGRVSSTTPLPSNGPYYGSTYGSTTPEEQNNYITGNTYQTPSQGLITSTTPLPSQKPNYEGSYQQNTNEPQYQSTFRPAETLRPTTKNINGTTAQRLPPVSSTSSTSNVVPYKSTQYGNGLPSTTYRPDFTITAANEPSTTATPGIVVDGFGRPIRPEYSSTGQDYTSGATSSGQPISDQSTKAGYQPGGTSSELFRGQQRYRPGTKLGQQEVSPTFQSTTQKIIGEDFSGPKQQKKFDPKTGYYYK